MRLRIAVVAGLTLVLGFAVASMSGNRPLGGIVLVAGGAVCAVWMQRWAGWPRTAAMLVIALAMFAVSHPLGELIGAWPAVGVVALVTGVAAYLLAGGAASKG